MPRLTSGRREIVNFGGNVRFRPRAYYEPRTETDVLDILRDHARGHVRVIGARHAWSPLIATDDAAVSLRHFQSVVLRVDERGDTWATVGGGWQVKHLLQVLDRHGLTLPAIGLITEQTIAGTIATGTHGSGNQSLGHYIQEVRIAAYDAATGEPRIHTLNSGAELQAVRCHLGCLGIVLSVTFCCRPQYCVGEINSRSVRIEEVLASEAEYPLQHFFLVPHRWTYTVQHRREMPPVERPLYRLDMWSYFVGWFITMDVGLHLVFKLLVSVLRSRALIRAFFRYVMPYVLLEDKVYIGRSDRVLTWEHELFRHFEIEVFVPKEHVADACRFVAEVLQAADGVSEAPAGEQRRLIEEIGMRERLDGLRGVFTHHYPICVRRVLRDEALISMSSGEDEAWYAFSFITLQQPRDAFQQMADFLAESMARLFRARLHWGKYFPLDGAHAAAAYPRLAEFAAICRRYDPHGVFQNEFTRRVLSDVEISDLKSQISNLKSQI